MLREVKDELNTLLMTELIALSPKEYCISRQTLIELNEVKIKSKRALKAVSKFIVKKEIKHDDYFETNDAFIKCVVSIRIFSHQFYTFKQQKIALTSFYDQMQSIDKVNCVPYCYFPSAANPRRRT